ncbi:TPA: hypothetical protein RNT04_001040 [Stenotrophomonas maltophilia]|uniref:hypothetical protein n=1 Tax=Stenotrophomonas maltophilia TaxID=40324 RepID=UPI0018D37681|nr:hypothetical protein [Stenotrophomonas maltophilia]MBH1603961.1 hypothetical protein [Stenotrophomonas maltophilia]MDT3472300.1 hypothetical protein [Stenotrophomonas maltophilia]MDT3473886.1 hypothetical protein [Stenotrophomonas maltophilia]HDX0788043.1 hypothetical protein [Stenotrophomonas maltophilia]HDX0806457.1 hypothetical protein [Stenotrophomonas maltophilia]
MSEIELKARIISILSGHTREMEGYSYFSSNPGIPEDEYEEIADEVIAALAPQWQPIESAPEDGKCLVAVETDDGWWYGQLERDKRGNWIHEGEPTYCKSYYFNPHSWQPLPAPPEVK